ATDHARKIRTSNKFVTGQRCSSWPRIDRNAVWKMKPSPIARKLKRPSRKVPAPNAIIVRITAARKQVVETIRSCRSTGCVTLKLFSIMNTKRLILAIVVAFVVLWVTDFLIHGVWMVPDYRGTQQLWRTDAAMGSRISWMLGAQLLFAITFVLLWTRWAETARLGCAIGYGFLMGLFSGTWAIIMYVVIPNALLNRLQMVLRRYRAINLDRCSHFFSL